MKPNIEGDTVAVLAGRGAFVPTRLAGARADVSSGACRGQ